MLMVVSARAKDPNYDTITIMLGIKINMMLDSIVSSIETHIKLLMFKMTDKLKINT